MAKVLNNVETTETAQTTEVVDGVEMSVQQLVAPDRLKELRDQQRALRIETKNVKEALKKQAEDEKAAKLDKLTPEERTVAMLLKSLHEVAKQIKGQEYPDALKAIVKLRKQIEAANGEPKAPEDVK